MAPAKPNDFQAFIHNGNASNPSFCALDKSLTSRFCF